jgi:hypothetical protein
MAALPMEITDRYAAGERTIRVSPDVFESYCNGLQALYLRVPNIRHDTERWLAYKDARIVLDGGGL